MQDPHNGGGDDLGRGPKGEVEEKNQERESESQSIPQWHLVQDNVLGFLRMFKDSHVWLQITPGNQMSGKSRFPP